MKVHSIPPFLVEEEKGELEANGSSIVYTRGDSDGDGDADDDGDGDADDDGDGDGDGMLPPTLLKLNNDVTRGYQRKKGNLGGGEFLMSNLILFYAVF